jgi:hypothetical protein
MPIGRNHQDPRSNGTNFGVINSGSGSINGPVQVAAFSTNVSQTNHIAPNAVERAQEGIEDLRQRLEAVRDRYPEADQALRALDAISPSLETPEHNPGGLRYMLEHLTTACAAIPPVVTAAQAVHSAVVALLPA